MEHLELLASVATQLMNKPDVTVDQQQIKVARVGTNRLRIARFTLNGRLIAAIEQNRSKPSRWGRLAQKGHQVVQFQDVVTRKYLAVAVDGEVFEYGKP